MTCDTFYFSPVFRPKLLIIIHNQGFQNLPGTLSPLTFYQTKPSLTTGFMWNTFHYVISRSKNNLAEIRCFTDYNHTEYIFICVCVKYLNSIIYKLSKLIVLYVAQMPDGVIFSCFVKIPLDLCLRPPFSLCVVWKVNMCQAFKLCLSILPLFHVCLVSSLHCCFVFGRASRASMEKGRRAVCAHPGHLAAQRGRGRGGRWSRGSGSAGKKRRFPSSFSL